MVKVEKFLALIFFLTILHYVIFIQYLDFDLSFFFSFNKTE